MLEAGIIASLGVIVVLTFVYLRRAVGSAGAVWWAWAWISVWVSGLLASVDHLTPWVAGLASGLGNLFMFFTLAGALAFAGRRPPRGLVVAALATSALRLGFEVAGLRLAAHLFAVPLEVGLGLAATAVLWRRPGRGPAQLLPWALLALTIVDGVDLVLRSRDGNTLPTVLAWVVVGFTLALLQILALVDEVRAREEDTRADLARERSILRAILDTAPVGVLLTGHDGTAQVVNRLAPVHWGFPDAEAMRGVTAAALAAEILPRVLNADRFQEEVQRARHDRFAVIEDAEFHLAPPDDRTLDLFSSPVVDEREGRLGRVFVTRDVTAERRLEEQLRQAQKMETLGTLAGGLAHDFNNQLTAILGNVRFAREAGPGDEEATRGALVDLERAAEHCASLTRGLLAFARHAPVHLRPLALPPVLEEVEHLLRASLPCTVSLSLELEADLRPVRGDATQLQQLLLNLAVNARDAVGERGHIRIRGRNREEGGGPDPAEERTGPFVELEVEDDGTGMDAWTRRRVFDPFFTTKPPGAGTGLGLAIVYGVARAHGGTVEVESEPGRGTRVRVRLPASTEPPQQASAPEAAAGEAGTGTVLLAEDDELVRRLARRSLERAGYRVVEARDGDEAVEAFLRDPDAVDVLVCDLSMPRRSGADAIAAIRRRAPGLPAVLASGHFDAGAPEATPGVLRLPKPYAPAGLVAHVREALAGRDGSQAAPPGGRSARGA